MNRRTLLVNALKKGGHVLSRYFGRVSYLEKGRANLVTKADLESQRTILNLIKAHVPGDDYIAEENASQSNGADYLWLIDPLDGTTNYAHGYPASCVSIGVLYRGRPILGGVYDPFRQELFLAEAGRGATLNGQRLHVSKTRRVEDSLLVTGFGYDRAERPDFYLSPFKSFLVTCHDIRRSGSAALDMAWIAAGRVDGFWELNLKPWGGCPWGSPGPFWGK
jgi:myo-inositol-1(or 4)-monophosphatase